jgi:hypothetical protein
MLVALLGLCAGCASLQRPPSNVASLDTACVGRMLQTPDGQPCAPQDRFPPGVVITHPNGNGPQVVLWGPPDATGGSAG